MSSKYAPRVRHFADNEITTYRKDGVVHLPRLIEPECVPQLLEAADRRAMAPGPNATEMAVDGRFFEDRDIWREEEAFRTFSLDSGLAAQIARVWDAKSVRLYFDHLFLLAEDTAKDKYYWHQDLPYWACKGDQICSVWLALTDCAADSGALEFVIGTDRDELYAPVTFGDEKMGEIADLSKAPIPPYHEHKDRYDIRSWKIRAGDALLFNSRIMHSSRGNHSKTQRRVAYSTRWIGEQMVYWEHPWWQDPVTIPQPRPIPGTPLNDPRFPIAWQRT